MVLGEKASHQSAGCPSPLRGDGLPCQVSARIDHMVGGPQAVRVASAWMPLPLGRGRADASRVITKSGGCLLAHLRPGLAPTSSVQTRRPWSCIRVSWFADK